MTLLFLICCGLAGAVDGAGGAATAGGRDVEPAAGPLLWSCPDIGGGTGGNVTAADRARRKQFLGELLAEQFYGSERLLRVAALEAALARSLAENGLRASEA